MNARSSRSGPADGRRFDIALRVIVFRQLREERLTARTILGPLALMGWAGFDYLHGVPTAGNDLTLIGLPAGVGVVFGLFGGLLTRVRSRSGNVYLKATLPAVALWVVSMGFRMGLDVWSNYGSGVHRLAAFSAAQGLNNRQVAGEMFVSEATVKSQLNHILAKLAMQDRAALIAWAWRHGLAGSSRSEGSAGSS